MVERSEDVAFTPPKDLRIEMIAPGKKLDEMLAEGDSAMLSPDLPKLFLKGDKRIVRMFPNYKEIELAYFRKTGIFPIMHVTTIKQEIVDKYPWVPTNLVKAFEAAKTDRLPAHRQSARMVPLAWVRTAVEEQGCSGATLGLRADAANRKNLETVLRYTHQQGMISRTCRSTSCSPTPISATPAARMRFENTMTFEERLAAIRANMAEQKLDLLVAIHDGAHFIETPNPVFVLSGFKSLGPAAVVLGATAR